MDKIVPAFETTLFDSTLSDACVDMAEMGIDTLLDEGIYRADRLMALGLLDSATKSMTIGSVSGSQTQRYIQVNELGSQYCEIGLCQ